MNGHRFNTVEACVFENDFSKEVMERLNDLESSVYKRTAA